MNDQPEIDPNTVTRMQFDYLTLHLKGRGFAEIGRLKNCSRQCVEDAVKKARARIEECSVLSEKSKSQVLSIKEHRKMRGITQGVIAQAMKISTVAYNTKEKGTYEFKISEARILATYFGLTIDELFGFDLTPRRSLLE